MTIKQRMDSAYRAIGLGDWARATLHLERLKRITRSERKRRAFANAARVTANRIQVA